MAIFKGKLTQNGTDNAVINPLTNGFPNDLTGNNLVLVRESVGVYNTSLALSALLNDNECICFIQPDMQYSSGTCCWNGIDQLIHKDADGNLSDDFAASIYIESVLF